MTPILDSINSNHSLGRKLQSVDDKHVKLANTEKDTPIKNNNASPDSNRPPITSDTNITDKITLTSLQNDTKESHDNDDDGDDDREHENTNIDRSNNNALLLNTSRQSALESNINITTKEGDTVNLNFSRSSSSEQTYTSENGGFTYLSESTSSVALSISIDGDLNKNERKSILKLVEKIDDIVNKFSTEETQDALYKIQELGIKSEQLSQFSFSFKQSTTQTALIAYQANKDIPTTNDKRINDSNNPIATSAKLAENINNTALEIDEILKQENPFDTLIGIFSEINRIKQPETVGIEKRQLDFAQFVREIFEDKVLRTPPPSFLRRPDPILGEAV